MKTLLRAARGRVFKQTSFRELLGEIRGADVAAAALVAGWLPTRLGPGRLSLSEYCRYRLPKFPAEERKSFVGSQGQGVLIDILADDYSKILNLDKLTFDLVARQAGLPVPEIFAVYAPRQRPGSFPTLTNSAELGDFLRGWQRFPIYCKPSCGDVVGLVFHGNHNFRIDGWAGDRIAVSGGAAVSVEDLASRLAEPTGFGFLLTETLRPHAEIAAVAGDSISGVRLHVLRLKEGPTIFRPVWKVARRGAVVDNFQHGASGNMLAAVDRASGRVWRVVDGMGYRQRENLHHPDTGAQLVGFQLPHWQALKAMVRQAPDFAPGFLCQAWDVAICPERPVLMEVNWFGDVDLSQHAYGRGFLEDEVLDLLHERNLAPLVAGRSARSRACGNGRFGRRKAHWSY